MRGGDKNKFRRKYNHIVSLFIFTREHNYQVAIVFIVPDAVKVYKHFKSQDANIENKVRNYTFSCLKLY